MIKDTSPLVFHLHYITHLEWGGLGMRLSEHMDSTDLLLLVHDASLVSIQT